MASVQGRFVTALLSLVLAAGVSPRASAWGNEGHQTVGAVADTLIAGTNAEVQVRTLLVAGESLSKVSLWADCAKGYCGPLTPGYAVRSTGEAEQQLAKAGERLANVLILIWP